ncbi:hypothetical protein C8R44DRAFT_865385 [Mycena epipterygia]|nr:hypothetical protein C8R44DRAFT_865385 [Mycena epipterygia]
MIRVASDGGHAKSHDGQYQPHGGLHWGPSRPFIHKICVAGLIFCDTICALAVCVDVTMAVVGIHTPNIRLILTPLFTAIITTYLAASIAQGFLCNLYRILTGFMIITTLLVALIVVHCAAAILALTMRDLGGWTDTATTIGSDSD